MASTLLHIFDASGKRLKINALLEKDKSTIELGRLTQGIRTIQGNDAIEFIPHSAVQKHKKVAYANMICDFRPIKAEKNIGFALT